MDTLTQVYFRHDEGGVTVCFSGRCQTHSVLKLVPFGDLEGICIFPGARPRVASPLKQPGENMSCQKNTLVHHAMEKSLAPRPANVQRAEWRVRCRETLSNYIRGDQLHSLPKLGVALICLRTNSSEFWLVHPAFV